MATWRIEQMHVGDLEKFVQCQFLAFVENPLHDVVYPNYPVAVETHRKAISDGSKLQPGNEIIYLTAVDNNTGAIVGGIKFCHYASEDVHTRSPYAAGIADAEAGATDDEQYCHYVVNEFLGKRVRDIKGQHARTFISKPQALDYDGWSNAQQSSISSLCIPNTNEKRSVKSSSLAQIQ